MGSCRRLPDNEPDHSGPSSRSDDNTAGSSTQVSSPIVTLPPVAMVMSTPIVFWCGWQQPCFVGWGATSCQQEGGGRGGGQGEGVTRRLTTSYFIKCFHQHVEVLRYEIQSQHQCELHQAVKWIRQAFLHPYRHRCMKESQILIHYLVQINVSWE